MDIDDDQLLEYGLLKLPDEAWHGLMMTRYVKQIEEARQRAAHG